MFGSGVKQKLATTGAALAIGLALPLAGAAGAQAAAPTPAGEATTDGTNSVYCEPNTHIQNQVTNSNYHFGIGIVYKNGPGGSVSATNTATATVGTAFTVTTGASAGITAPGLTASAKVDVSAQVSASVSVGTAVQFSHNITNGKYGNLQYGAWGYSANWQKVQVYSNCTNKTLASGTAKYPTARLGWNYWES